MEPASFAKCRVCAFVITMIFFSVVGCKRGDDVTTTAPSGTQPVEAAPEPADRTVADRPIADAPASGSAVEDGGSVESTLEAPPAEEARPEAATEEAGPPAEEVAVSPESAMDAAPRPQVPQQPAEQEPQEDPLFTPPPSPFDDMPATETGAPSEPQDKVAVAPAEVAEDIKDGQPDLGDPLVDVENPEDLVRLDPKYPVWFDKSRKSVVLVGQVCQRHVPLELFACLKGSKEHESIVSIATGAYVVHAGLLVAGVEPGGPVQFRPEYVPARGPEIEVTLIWKDAAGNVRRAPAQEWIRDMETGKQMEHPWVFAGSVFSRNERTGEQIYHADVEGDLICVSNFPSAVLDLPIQSSDSNTSLLYEAFTERIPPLGTPVTLVLTPKPPTEEKDAAEDSEPTEPDADAAR